MFKSILVSIAKSPTARQVFMLVLAACLGAFVYAKISGPRVTIVERPGAVQEKIVYVDKPVLTEKIVTKYVTDRVEVQKVMMENAYLENQVATLNETITRLKSTGSGQIVYVDRPVPGETRTVREGNFKDWRLNFTFAEDKANYTLDQQFETITVLGKDKQGKPFATTKVLEVGPGETRTPLTNVKATTVQANVKDAGKRWLFSASLQAGFAGTVQPSATTSKNAAGGVVGVKWLTRGYTKAAEDGVFSLLTPVVFLTKDVQEVGVLPISFNLGRVPKQPFRDLWVAPLVTFTGSGTGRVGFSILATF